MQTTTAAQPEAVPAEARIYIPLQVLTHSDLDANAKLIYGALDRFHGRDGLCFPSHQTLADLVGCHVATVKRSLKKLRQYGFVFWRNTRGSSRYSLPLKGTPVPLRVEPQPSRQKVSAKTAPAANAGETEAAAAPAANAGETAAEAKTPWTAIAAKLRKTIAGDAFDNWLEPLSFKTLEGGRLELIAPNVDACEWLESRYADTISQAADAIGEPIESVTFIAMQAPSSGKLARSQWQAPDLRPRPAMPGEPPHERGGGLQAVASTAAQLAGDVVTSSDVDEAMKANALALGTWLSGRAMGGATFPAMHRNAATKALARLGDHRQVKRLLLTRAAGRTNWRSAGVLMTIAREAPELPPLQVADACCFDEEGQHYFALNDEGLYACPSCKGVLC